jgi:hypothetical protein
VRLITAAVAALLLLAGCSSGSGGAQSATTSPSPAQTGPFVGFWQGHTKDTGVNYLFGIVRTGSTYRVAASGWAPWPAPIEQGRLIVHRYGQQPPKWSRSGPLAWYGLELAWNQGHVVAVLVARHGVFERDVLTRTSAASYDRQNREWADANAPSSSLGLYVAIREWQKQHAGVPPAASDLNPSSAFGKWLQAQPHFGSWPINLYTGAPMQTGTEPGDFTYTIEGSKFMLVVHLSGGKDFLAP